MKRLLAAVPTLTMIAACSPLEPVPTHSREVLSDVYTIDRKYQSMQGPSQTLEITLIETPDQPELLWVTGYRAEVVGPDGMSPMPPEFMCHSNLGFDAEEHRRLFGWTRRTARRLFTVSQGQEEVEFPEGFGIPLMSNEPLSLTTQVLNHNHPDTTLQARVRVTIDYVRDRDLRTPYVPLYMKSANAMVRLDNREGGYGSSMSHDREHEGAPQGMAAGSRVIRDQQGREFAGHWVVPPGRQQNTTNVTGWMQIPPDARVHHIAVHLHPFAQTVALRDVTNDATIFESQIRNYSDRIGLEYVSSFSSVEGFTLVPDHEYALESVYDNPTSDDQEAMVVMYLYLRDNQFTKPGGP